MALYVGGLAGTELPVAIAIPPGSRNETSPRRVPSHRKVTACFTSSLEERCLLPLPLGF